jgi:hypothetical protein
VSTKENASHSKTILSQPQVAFENKQEQQQQQQQQQQPQQQQQKQQQQQQEKVVVSGNAWPARGQHAQTVKKTSLYDGQSSQEIRLGNVWKDASQHQQRPRPQQQQAQYLHQQKADIQQQQERSRTSGGSQQRQSNAAAVSITSESPIFENGTAGLRTSGFQEVDSGPVGMGKQLSELPEIGPFGPQHVTNTTHPETDPSDRAHVVNSKEQTTRHAAIVSSASGQVAADGTKKRPGGKY